MGHDFYVESHVFKKIFDEASDRLGYSLKELCFKGEEEHLRATNFAQPAVYTMAYGILSILNKEGIMGDMVAGHSLGEYAAVAGAGGFSFQDGLHIVSRRGQLMNEIQRIRPGAMAAITGMSRSVVGSICDEVRTVGTVCLANINSPKQIVISGDERAVNKAVQMATRLGAENSKSLKVGAAFHSPLMKSIVEPLKEEILQHELNHLKVPFVSNVDARDYTNINMVVDKLLVQTISPVQWSKVIQAISMKDDVEFVELGPGKVLRGLIRRILPEADVTSIHSVKALNKWLKKRYVVS